jgi:hypothetical protein
VSLRLVPVNRDQALAFIAAVHRHHDRPQGYKYAVGVANGAYLVAVATAGRPVSRFLDDGWTVEVTRVASDGHPNACSILYGSCWRAAKALGFRRAITYTQDGESGASLRAAGWVVDAELDARGGWDTPSRPREDRGAGGVPRRRWRISVAEYDPQAPLPLLPESVVDDPQLDLFALAGGAG